MSTVNVAFLDMSSAFDKVVHNVLFQKLIKLNVPPTVLKLLFIWYMNSNVYVRWGAYTSYTFMLSAGVRQGGVLSPILFCIYVDCIVQRLESSKLGCWIGELYVGCILYADDLILISSSVCELQKMVDLCADVILNVQYCDSDLSMLMHVLLYGFRTHLLTFVIRLNILVFSSSPIRYFQLI